jgi:hypothetical protein
MPPGSRLDSWKEIAQHLGRSVRTVQRWEIEQRLPVHRLSLSRRGAVYAVAEELDAWWAERSGTLAGATEQPLLRTPSKVWQWWAAALLVLAMLGASWFWLGGQ